MRKLSLILFLLSLPFLFYALYEISISNVIAENNRERYVEQYRVGAGTDIELRRTEALLYLPSLGGKYVAPVLDGTSLDVLDSGVVGRLENNTHPGDVGNLVLMGHRITHGEVFRDLPSLDVGDRIVVEQDGRTFEYVVNRPPFDIHESEVWVVEDATYAKITLITCNSFLPTDHRTVVVGSLAEKDS